MMMLDLQNIVFQRICSVGLVSKQCFCHHLNVRQKFGESRVCGLLHFPLLLMFLSLDMDFLLPLMAEFTQTLEKVKERSMGNKYKLIRAFT